VLCKGTSLFTCWSDFKCFNVKLYINALVGVIIKVIKCSSVSSICSCRRNTMNTEISTDCNSDGISSIDEERNGWRNHIQVP